MSMNIVKFSTFAILLFIAHWAIACKCSDRYKRLTMREYNTHTIFVGKLLSARTPPENSHAIELKYQVVTNYRNTPVGDTITVYRNDGCDLSTDAYLQIIGSEHLIYAQYNIGSYDWAVCAELSIPPRESLEALEEKIRKYPNHPSIDHAKNAIQTWQLIDEVKNRANKMIKSYHANGVLEAKGKLKNSMPDGEWKYYDEKGRLIETITYKEGIKWGKSKWNTYDSDTTYSVIRYYENDMEISSSTWTNGKLSSKSWGTGLIYVNSYRKSLSQISDGGISVFFNEKKEIINKQIYRLIDKEKIIYFTFLLVLKVSQHYSCQFAASQLSLYDVNSQYSSKY